jgi:uncharacterized membrane protein required for colicin V production
MIVLDVLAAFAIAFGGFIGARRGFWRMATGSGAVALGAAAGWSLVDVLADALGDFGVGYPGDRLLGFFLPFAVVSVYARFLAGLWLSKLLEDQPDRNRTFGALAGAVWMMFVAGFVGRIAGLAPESTIADESPGHKTSAPFASWLAEYPGGLSGFALAAERASADDAEGASWSEAVETALDSNRVHTRSVEADREASARLGASPRPASPHRLAATRKPAPPPLNQR